MLPSAHSGDGGTETYTHIEHRPCLACNLRIYTIQGETPLTHATFSQSVDIECLYVCMYATGLGDCIGHRDAPAEEGGRIFFLVPINVLIL